MPKNLVKVILLFSLAHQSSGDKEENAAHYKKCRQLCKDYLQGDFKISNVCQGAHNIEPAHSEIHKACLKGKFMGFEHACMPACMGEDYLGRQGAKLGSSHEACKKYWKKPVPNNQLPWCRRGYDFAYDTVQKEILTFVAEEGFDENIKSPANAKKTNSKKQIQGDEHEKIVLEEVQKPSVPSKAATQLKSQKDENILKAAKIKVTVEDDEKSSDLSKAPVEIHNQDGTSILNIDSKAQLEEKSNVAPKEGTDIEETTENFNQIKHSIDTDEGSEGLFNDAFEIISEKEPSEWDKFEDLVEVKDSRSLEGRSDQL